SVTADSEHRDGRQVEAGAEGAQRFEPRSRSAGHRLAGEAIPSGRIVRGWSARLPSGARRRRERRTVPLGPLPGNASQRQDGGCGAQPVPPPIARSLPPAADSPSAVEFPRRIPSMVEFSTPRTGGRPARRALSALMLLVVAGTSAPAFAQQAASADAREVPLPTVTGPIANEGFDSPAHFYQFFRSDVALESHGYVEAEYFVEG